MPASLPPTSGSPPPGDVPRSTPKVEGGRLRLVAGVLLLAVIALGLLLPFTPYAGRIKRGLEEIVRASRPAPEPQVIVKEVIKEVPVEVTKEVIREVPAEPEPLPSKFIERKDVDVATLFNGITVKTQLQTEQGTFATLERLDPTAYRAEFQLNIRVPKANQSLDELARINEHLPKILPGLGTLLEGGKVSDFYHRLYENKTRRVQTDLTRLNRALDRHNFFDCETILELTHPTTRRRVLLIQSEMDVVADGSDGDRMASLDEYIFMSDYYQPFTSYAWPKRSATPNPLLARWEARLTKLKAEYAVKGLSAAKNEELRAGIAQVTREIADLKARSSLIAEKDPFVVLSLLFRGYEKTNEHTPGMGDYAAVIHGDRIYPAICGDYGPTFKMGEASLLLAKTINDKATPYRRPVSDLKVTYVVFPGSAEKPWGPPDLKRWQQQVTACLGEVGGIGAGYKLHEWPDPFAKPEPAPVEATTPTAVPPTPPVPAAPPVPTAPPAPTAPVEASPAGGGQ